MMELRDYQIEAVNRVYEQWDHGLQNVCLQAATGSGKTAMLAYIMLHYPKPSIAIAHRTELVSQLSLTLAQYGVYHNIIAPRTTIREIVTLHTNTFGQSFYDPQATRYVAGVLTLLNHKHVATLAKRIGLTVFDECFVAGTLIDGKPIEDIRVGDSVWAFNEATDRLEKREVVRVFKNIKPKHMVRIETKGHHVLHCTLGHPFYTKRGWVEAKDLKENDYVRCEMYHLWGTCRFIRLSISKVCENTKSILRKKVFGLFSNAETIRNNGGYKSEVRFSENDTQQSYAKTRSKIEDVQHIESDKTQAQDSRRKRQRNASCRTIPTGIVNGYGVYDATSSTNATPANCWIPMGVQARLRKFISEIGDRSRWCISSWEKAFRREKRPMLDWARLDSITFYESGDIRTAGQSDNRNYVYNFEVDQLHTYVANGVVTHNCHHVIRGNTWGKVAALFGGAQGLFPTATPQRADGKGLGRHADGVIDSMVLAIPMRDLITQGYLTPYIIYAPPNSLDLSHVNITASGEYSPPKLADAVRNSSIVGNCVDHYLRIAPGELGITFAVNIESSIEIANAYRAAGVSAETISSKTPTLVRASIMRRFRNREILQLVNVDILGEGVDVPTVSVVSMCRPTASYNVFVQQFGRCLRPAQGKTHGILIDHVGNTIRHGLPDAYRAWTLDRRERRARTTIAEIPLKVCLNLTCMGVYPRTLRVCPNCGFYTPPTARSTPAEVDGDLMELSPEVLAAMRGEIARIDGPVHVPQSVSTIAQLGIANNHRNRREAQVQLRASIAQWAGYLHAAGDSDSVIHRTFYFRFGIDVLTAQTLGVTEATKLQVNIDAACAAY
jgi:superfamily II DNA or RNA helicase